MKINKETKVQIKDFETGELKEEVVEQTYNLPSEPDYIKLYFNDLIKLKDLPKSNNGVLMALLRRTTYRNEVAIFGQVKKDICDELQITMNTLSKAVDNLYKAEILLRKGRGLYIINPYYFGRGKWNDIHRIRMSIEYSFEQGRRILKPIFNDQAELFDKLDQKIEDKNKGEG